MTLLHMIALKTFDKLVSICKCGFITFLNCLSMQTKQWNVLKMLPVPFGTRRITYPILYSQENNLFAFLQNSLTLMIYNESDYQWEEINVAFEKYGLSRNFHVTFIHATPEIVVFLTYVEKELKYVLINLRNVVNLKDICFLKLYNYYNCSKRLPEKSIRRGIFDLLPVSLKCRYFGSCYSSS